MSTIPTTGPSHRLPPGEWSRWWGLRFRLRERFSVSLFLVPSLYIVAALLLAEFVPTVEGDRDVVGLGLDPETARTMLSAIAGGMIAFTGLVVSIAIVVVQFGAAQYTPRLVNLFRRDPRVKHSLGVFIAPAIFALVAMRKIGEAGSEVVPSLTMLVAMGLLIAAVLAFFLLVAGLLDLLRPRLVIDTVVRQASAAIREIYPPASDASEPVEAPTAMPVATVVRHHGAPGVISALDRGRLVRAARAGDAVVEVVVGVGTYVPTGAPLFQIRGADPHVDTNELRASAMLAVERTIAQDPTFAMRTIVDLALRALSPAVNDPTTAVQAIDGLESILRELSSRSSEGRGVVCDSHGVLRLTYPHPDWSELVDLAVTEIRHYGADTPQVARRLRALLDDLLAETTPLRHEALRAQLALLDAAIDRAYPEGIEREHARQADRLGLGSHQLRS